MLVSTTATLIAYVFIAIIGMVFAKRQLGFIFVLFIWFIIYYFADPSSLRIYDFFKIVTFFSIIEAVSFFPLFVISLTVSAFGFDFLYNLLTVGIDKTNMLQTQFMLILYYFVRPKKLIKFDGVFFILLLAVCVIQSLLFDSRSLLLLVFFMILIVMMESYKVISKYILFIPIIYVVALILSQDLIFQYFGMTKSNIERIALLTTIANFDLYNFIFPDSTTYVNLVNSTLSSFDNQAYSDERLDPHSFYASVFIFCGSGGLILFLYRLNFYYKKINWLSICPDNRYLSTVLLAYTLILISQSPPSTDIRYQIAIYIGLMAYFSKRQLYKTL